MRLTFKCAHKNVDMTEQEVSIELIFSPLQNATEEHLINVISSYFNALSGIVTLLNCGFIHYSWNTMALTRPQGILVNLPISIC